MVCGFMGHRDAPREVKKLLEQVIKELIRQGTRCFYVGNNGNFDLYTQQVLKEIAEREEGVIYYILLSSPRESALAGQQERTLYSEGLEKVPFRFAIAKRNEILLQKADVFVVYQKYSFSNSYKWVQRAIKAGKRIINLI